MLSRVIAKNVDVFLRHSVIRPQCMSNASHFVLSFFTEPLISQTAPQTYAGD